MEAHQYGAGLHSPSTMDQKTINLTVHFFLNDQIEEK